MKVCLIQPKMQRRPVDTSLKAGGCGRCGRLAACHLGELCAGTETLVSAARRDAAGTVEEVPAVPPHRTRSVLAARRGNSRTERRAYFGSPKRARPQRVGGRDGGVEVPAPARRDAAGTVVEIPAVPPHRTRSVLAARRGNGRTERRKHVGSPKRARPQRVGGGRGGPSARAARRRGYGGGRGYGGAIKAFPETDLVICSK